MSIYALRDSRSTGKIPQTSRPQPPCAAPQTQQQSLSSKDYRNEKMHENKEKDNFSEERCTYFRNLTYLCTAFSEASGM